MGQITIEKNIAGIEGLTLFHPTLHPNNRGCFFEADNEHEFAKLGFSIHFVQDNQCISHKGVLRGLHYQKKFLQGKLVRAITGSFFDVAVDIRKDSRTFGKYYGTIISDQNHVQMYLPAGFAHGYLVLLDEGTIFFAQVTDYQHLGDGERLRWDAPDIGIHWPMELLGGTELIISEKDKKNAFLSDLSSRNTD